MMAFLCTQPLVSALLSGCAPPPPLATGYVEGEYVLLAPVETGRIERVAKRRGDRVLRGEELVRMEDADAEIAVQEAEAASDQARAQLANLREGRRPEEIAVITATLTSARAQAEEAQRIFDRQRDLLKRGIAPQADFDEAKTRLDQADAQVAQAAANLEVARLPARGDEIKAAEAQVRQAQSRLDNARWRLNHRILSVPHDGVVTDIVRREGEVAGPSQPVLSVLPDGGVKLRLYMGEAALSQISLGQALTIRCDGCRPGLTARISYLSDSPEYTPPVIYSLESRQKLVYLVEARPDGDSDGLKPGLIVDAVLPDAKP